MQLYAMTFHFLLPHRRRLPQYWQAWNVCVWRQKTHLSGGTRQLEQRQYITWIQRGFKELHSAAAAQKEGEASFSVMSLTAPVQSVLSGLLSNSNPAEDPSRSLIQNSHKDSPSMRLWVTDCVWALELCFAAKPLQTAPKKNKKTLPINTAGAVDSLQYHTADKASGMNESCVSSIMTSQTRREKSSNYSNKRQVCLLSCQASLTHSLSLDGEQLIQSWLQPQHELHGHC